MAITKEQWQKIEQELSFAYGSAKLKCDGYDVGLYVTLIDTLQYGILVYVNGQFQGKWLMEDCEERRRFLRPVERFLYNAKEREQFLKIWGGKRAPKSKVEQYNRKFTTYCNYWMSVKSLRRHIEKNNKEVELVAVGGEEVTRAEALAA